MSKSFILLLVIIVNVIIVNVESKKFIEDPTVEIRTLINVINKSSDDIVELYMDNPTIDDKYLIVDLRVTYPSWVEMYGQGFSEASTKSRKFHCPV